MSDIVIALEVTGQNNIILQASAEEPIAVQVANFDGVGPQGLSAYQIAVAQGAFVGTEEEFAQSLAHILVGPAFPPNPVLNQLFVNTSL